MADDMETRFKELEAKVRGLTDREALRDLRYRYHECINEGKFAEIPNLFTADADLDFGALGKARGREQLNKFFIAMDMTSVEACKSPLRVSYIKQFVHNHTVHVHGDTGDGFAYLERRNGPVLHRTDLCGLCPMRRSVAHATECAVEAVQPSESVRWLLRDPASYQLLAEAFELTPSSSPQTTATY